MIVPYPSRAAGALGLAAVRGIVAPVYDLRVLLGHARASGPPPRWLLLARAPEPVALAFDQLESYLRLPPRLVSSPEVEEHARRHVRGAVRSAEGVRPLIDVAAILAAITFEPPRSDDHV
jgi:chemotaxis signal transduction protein